YAQYRMLTPRPQPQVPVIHQKFDAVLFRADRVFARQLEYSHVLDVEFVYSGLFRMFSRRPSDDDRGFLRDLLGVLPDLVAYVFFRDDALNNARSVADLQEGQFAARTFVVKPP